MSASSEGYLFDYRDEGNPPVKRPTVDVTVCLPPDVEWTCRALVDTGSPRTVFDRGMADALGIRIRYDGLDEPIALMGKELRIQIESVDLVLVGMDEVWSTEVGFIRDPEFRMPFQGILGHKGFLDRFDVRFSGYRERFHVLRPS